MQISISSWSERVSEFLELTRAEYSQTNETAFSDESVFRALLNGCNKIHPKAAEMLLELGILENGTIPASLIAAMPEILRGWEIDPMAFQCNDQDCPKLLRQFIQT